MKTNIESEIRDWKTYNVTRVSDQFYERFRGTFDLDTKPCCDSPSCSGSVPGRKESGTVGERVLIAALESLLETESELYMTTQYPSKCIPLYVSQGRTGYVLDQFKRMEDMKKEGREARAVFFAGKPKIHRGHPGWGSNEEIALLEIEGSHSEIGQIAYLLDKGMGTSGIWLGGSYDTDVYDGVGLRKLK